jgi:hypothetical protein
MDKEYEDLQFAENEFFRAYSLALKAAGGNKGTTSRVENIRTESDQKESELYTELQDGIKAAGVQASQSAARADPEQEQDDSTEKDIERLRKQYASRKTAVLEAATVKLRAIALGR